MVNHLPDLALLLDYIVASSRLPITLSDGLKKVFGAIVGHRMKYTEDFLFINAAESIARCEPVGIQICAEHLLAGS
jgi:hypothetical protein